MKSATKKQINYIELLVIDLEVSRLQRNTLISLELNRDVKYLDELTLDEASHIIDYFKHLVKYDASQTEDKEIRNALLDQIEISFDDNAGEC